MAESSKNTTPDPISGYDAYCQPVAGSWGTDRSGWVLAFDGSDNPILVPATK